MTMFLRDFFSMLPSVKNGAMISTVFIYLFFFLMGTDLDEIIVAEKEAQKIVDEAREKARSLTEGVRSYYEQVSQKNLSELRLDRERVFSEQDKKLSDEKEAVISQWNSRQKVIVDGANNRRADALSASMRVFFNE